MAISTRTAAAPVLRWRCRHLLVTSLGLTLLAAPTHLGAQEEPAGRDAGRRREAVRIQSGSASLGGTLFVPGGNGPHPVAVLIPGARNSTNLPGIAEYLTGRGVAVLDLDKRGVGSSTGRWDRQTFEERGADVLAAIGYLRSRPELDPERVGVVGHSQGGWIAQIVAAESADVAFVVLLAGPGQTVVDQILTDERVHRERRGIPEAQVEEEIASLRRQLRMADAVAPACRALRVHYLCNIIEFDPAPYLSRIGVPVLALFGELDPMVPPEPNAALLRRGLRRAGNGDVTIRVFPRANHLFWKARTGLRDEYGELEDEYVPGFLDALGTWMTARVLRERRSGWCTPVGDQNPAGGVVGASGRERVPDGTEPARGGAVPAYRLEPGPASLVSG